MSFTGSAGLGPALSGRDSVVGCGSVACRVSVIGCGSVIGCPNSIVLDASLPRVGSSGAGSSTASWAASWTVGTLESDVVDTGRSGSGASGADSVTSAERCTGSLRNHDQTERRRGSAGSERCTTGSS
jgi:hypothetical protein